MPNEKKTEVRGKVGLQDLFYPAKEIREYISLDSSLKQNTSSNSGNIGLSAMFQPWLLRLSAISLYLYEVRDIPQESSEEKSIHPTHHYSSHILLFPHKRAHNAK